MRYIAGEASASHIHEDRSRALALYLVRALGAALHEYVAANPPQALHARAVIIDHYRGIFRAGVMQIQYAGDGEGAMGLAASISYIINLGAEAIQGKGAASVRDYK